MTATFTRCGKVQVTMTQEQAIMLKNVLGVLSCTDPEPKFAYTPMNWDGAKFMSMLVTMSNEGLYDVLHKLVG